MTAWLSRGLFHLYQWDRHYVLGRPLTWWARVIPLLLAGFLLLLSPRYFPLSLACLLLVLGESLFFTWGRKRGYILFRRRESSRGDLHRLLEKGRRLSVTGWVEVEGRGMWVVAAPAEVDVFHNGERVLLVRVPPSGYAGVATLPHRDVGMWYRFLLPEDLEHYESGILWLAGRASPATCLLLPRAGKGRRLYLSTPFEVAGEVF